MIVVTLLWARWFTMCVSSLVSIAFTCLNAIKSKNNSNRASLSAPCSLTPLSLRALATFWCFTLFRRIRKVHSYLSSSPGLWMCGCHHLSRVVELGSSVHMGKCWKLNKNKLHMDLRCVQYATNASGAQKHFSTSVCYLHTFSQYFLKSQLFQLFFLWITKCFCE